jgi:hypothetical protein
MGMGMGMIVGGQGSSIKKTVIITHHLLEFIVNRNRNSFGKTEDGVQK